MLTALLLALAAQIPNDPLYPRGGWQQPGVSFLAPMHVEAAWAVTTGDQNVQVAVISTGVQPHPDLGLNLLPTINVVPRGADCLAGTRLASIIGANTNNGIGIAGVCWQVSIQSIRATGCGFTVSNHADMADAMDVARAIDTKIVLVDAPLYRYIPGGWDGHGGPYHLTRDAFDALVVTDALLICPAGDHGYYDDQTQDDPRILVVGATREDDTALDISDRGRMVDIAAPGGAQSAYASGQYLTSYSSSNAAAYVAGVAALVASVHPTWTGTQIRVQLMATARDVDVPGRDIRTGVGIVDAGAAVQ